jgi:hypothetical protein
MDQVIKLTKFKLPLSLLSIMISILGMDYASFGATNNLPVLRNVGIIPVQFEGSLDLTETLTNQISEAFAKAVSDAKRFHLIDRDLVSNLWAQTKGREELKNEYELDVYALLSVAQEGDILSLSARLMDSDLKTILLENDRIAIHEFNRLDPQEIQKKVESLTFRVINRLPNDVHVTSLQGPFVTLSGGHDQGIEPGDQIEILRSEITAIHPANGTWVEFKNSTKGAVQVVDAKETTSIARIVKQTNPRSIQVGDGAKVATLPSRVRFARLGIPDQFVSAGMQSSIVMPPIPLRQRVQESRPVESPNESADGSTQVLSASKIDPNPTAPPKSSGDPSKDEKDGSFVDKVSSYSDSMGSAWTNFSDEAMSHKLVDDLTVDVGPSWWSVKGPVDSSGAFPWWLLNSAEVGITRTMFYKLKAGFGGGALFGQTPAGTYLGYNGYGRIYWESPLDLSLIKVWRAGAQGNLSGISVSSGSFGGGDFIRGGVFAGLGGGFVVGESAQPYDWNAYFHLSPLNIGRMGYGGSFKDVESALGWKIDVNVFENNATRTFDLGGGITFGDERLTLKNGRRFHVND